MVVHNPVADSFVVAHILVEDSLAVGHNLVGDNLAVGNPAAAHIPVADIAAFHLAADNFVAAADSSFGYVRAAAALLPVVRNTCKTALRPATAGNNVYNA